MSEKVLVTNENSSLKFNGVSKIQFETNEKIFFGTYIVALPDYKRFSEFNNYFQIGMLFAINDNGINNEVEFILQENVIPKNVKDNFLIGPVNKELSKRLDGLISRGDALFLNEVNTNYYIALNSSSQLNALHEHLDLNEVTRVGIISDFSSDKKLERRFKDRWFKNNLTDVITINSDDDNANSTIRNFLDITESTDRFERIDKASFASIEFVPRARDDFKQIVLFPKDANRMYELASLVRFNYGLDYEIIALTSELDEKIDQNEINLHKISLIDHTYENKYGYDLNKSRSFSLGYDSMLISYAISNRYQGNIKGLLGTYIVRSNSIEFISYIN